MSQQSTLMDPDEGRDTPTGGPDALEKQLSTQSSVWQYERFSRIREIVFVAVICLSQFLTQASFGQILFTSRIIGEGLGTSSAGQRSWTIAAYSLTVGTFVLPAGRLGDIYGHKKIIVVGWTWFGIGSIIAGLSVFAPTGQGAVIMFCVFQALRGIGPAFVLPNAIAVLGRTYPVGKRKNMVFALFAMTAPTGAIVGGTFASIFAQLAWWPWALWSMGIAQLCVAAAAAVVVPADNRAQLSRGQKFDTIGACLAVSGLILFNFAWNQGASVGWATPYVPVLLVVGIILVVAFFYYEKRVEQPLMPPGVLNAGSALILTVVALGWASFGVFFYYAVEFVQVIRGATLLSTIAQFSPVAASGLTAAIMTGLIIAKIPPHWLISISAAAFAVGVILLTTMPAHQIYWAQLFVSLLILPFGMDISFPAASLLLSDRVPKRFQGVAASLVNTIINYSISIGLGVAGTAERTVKLEGASKLHGYRVALYTGVGMACGAFVIAASFGIYEQWVAPRRKTSAEETTLSEQAEQAEQEPHEE